MCYPELRHTHVYQEALRTTSVLSRAPGSSATGREALMRDAYRVRDAGLRLDHLMRNALNPDWYPYFPSAMHLSAIKAFVEVIENRLQRMSLPDPSSAYAFINPRLDLCRRIIARANTDLEQVGHPPVASDGFREFCTKWQLDVVAMVFDNPIYGIHTETTGPFGRNTWQERLHTQVLCYWE